MYDLILADPPWQYDDSRTRKSTGMARSAYEVMPLDEIASLPIHRIANPRSICALWCPNPKLQDGLHVLAAWGFQFVTVGFVWVKTYGWPYAPEWPTPTEKPALTIRPYSGLGHYTNSGTELVLFGRKGKMLPRADRSVKQVGFAPVTEHSAKPPFVHAGLEHLFGPVNRVELFSRAYRPGWDHWHAMTPDGYRLVQADRDGTMHYVDYWGTPGPFDIFGPLPDMSPAIKPYPVNGPDLTNSPLVCQPLIGETVPTLASDARSRVEPLEW